MIGFGAILHSTPWFHAIEVVTPIPTVMSSTEVSSRAGADPSRQPQKPPVKNPPVVIPGSGNNIIVNQRQASALNPQSGPLFLVKLTGVVAEESAARMYQTWQRVRGYRGRLPGW